MQKRCLPIGLVLAVSAAGCASIPGETAGTGHDVCSIGKEQSPIAIPTVLPSDEPDLDFDTRPTRFRVAGGGHGVVLEAMGPSHIAVGDDTYELLQFHFHAASEHHLEGRSLPLELHLVHRRGTELAVVGVLVTTGATNPAWAALAQGVAAGTSEIEVDPLALLPRARTNVRYRGSLTTPPCTEGVRWFVLTQPVEIGAEHLATLAHHAATARPLQPLGERVLVADSDEP